MTGVKILCYDIKYLLSNKMSHIKVKMHSTDLFMNLGFKVSKLQKRGGGGILVNSLSDFKQEF